MTLGMSLCKLPQFVTVAATKQKFREEILLGEIGLRKELSLLVKTLMLCHACY
jgi:hypothetical protein